MGNHGRVLGAETILIFFFINYGIRTFIFKNLELCKKKFS